MVELLGGRVTDKFFGVPTSEEKTEGISQKDAFSLLSKAVDNLTKGK
jgi:hypothetical protein